jgi:hypothetical protein
MSSPLALSDDDLSAIMRAAAPLRPHERDGFLRDIANEISKLPAVGPGALHRVITLVQRKHFDAPDLRVRTGKYR